MRLGNSVYQKQKINPCLLSCSTVRLHRPQGPGASVPVEAAGEPLLPRQEVLHRGSRRQAGGSDGVNFQPLRRCSQTRQALGHQRGIDPQRNIRDSSR